MWLIALIKNCHCCDLYLTSVVAYMKHQILWIRPFRVWGKLHDREVWFLIWNLLQLFLSLLIANWMLQWIDFKIELTLPLHFFYWVYKAPPWTWLQQKQAYKQATLNIWKVEHIKKWDGAANIPHIKRPEELDIPVGEVTDTMLGWSDTEENVLRLLQITQIQLSIQI